MYIHNGVFFNHEKANLAICHMNGTLGHYVKKSQKNTTWFLLCGILNRTELTDTEIKLSVARWGSGPSR